MPGWLAYFEAVANIYYPWDMAWLKVTDDCDWIPSTAEVTFVFFKADWEDTVLLA